MPFKIIFQAVVESLDARFERRQALEWLGRLRGPVTGSLWAVGRASCSKSSGPSTPSGSISSCRTVRAIGRWDAVPGPDREESRQVRDLQDYFPCIRCGALVSRFDAYVRTVEFLDRHDPTIRLRDTFTSSLARCGWKNSSGGRYDQYWGARSVQHHIRSDLG